MTVAKLECVGSSPRIRGESDTNDLIALNERIIPANTGRIFSSTVAAAEIADHPREYGENLWRLRTPAPPLGSSPRIRGEWSINLTLRRFGRIIPANTGRIPASQASCWFRGDHPREYGENQHRAAKYRSEEGSSPRIRGESPKGISGISCSRIIPANTGRMHP